MDLKTPTMNMALSYIDASIARIMQGVTNPANSDADREWLESLLGDMETASNLLKEELMSEDSTDAPAPVQEASNTLGFYDHRRESALQMARADFDGQRARESQIFGRASAYLQWMKGEQQPVPPPDHEPSVAVAMAPVNQEEDAESALRRVSQELQAERQRGAILWQQLRRRIERHAALRVAHGDMPADGLALTIEGEMGAIEKVLAGIGKQG